MDILKKSKISDPRYGEEFLIIYKNMFLGAIWPPPPGGIGLNKQNKIQVEPID